MTAQLEKGLAAAYESPAEQSALDHLWIHQANWVDLAERQGLHVFERGEGIYLYDVHGRRYIDAMAGLLVVNVGHGRGELADASAEQMRKLAYVSSANYTSVPAAELSAKIAELTPGDLERVFFSSGGSEAIETAIKIVKQVQFLRGFPKRYKIIARRGGYHGATFGAMSLTSNRAETEPLFGPFMHGVSHVSTIDHYRNDFGDNSEEGDLLAARAVEQEIRFQGPETVAAVIGEPISVSAGCHVPSKDYWRRLRRICDHYGVLLIMDEVINGWGRTGKLFATEHFGMVPDVMTMAKGLSSGYAPIAATVVAPSLYAEFQQEGRYLAHLLTFGGHAVSCAVALKNIEIIQRERLVENSAQMGDYLLAGLQRLVQVHPSVGDARGKGLMCGLELVRDKETRERWGKNHAFIQRLGQELDRAGMLLRILDVLVIAPPLVITREQVDDILTILDDALTTVEGEFGLRAN